MQRSLPLLMLFAGIVDPPGYSFPDRFAGAQEISLPGMKEVQIPSPNGRWVLIASAFRKSGEHTLALVDKRTSHRTLVKTYDRSLGVGWNPDSSAFFINDALGSSEEEAYLYLPARKHLVSLVDILQKEDPSLLQMPADHTYFRVRRWVNARSFILEYCGHNSANPAQQFDLHYTVDLSPASKLPLNVRRIAADLSPLSISKPECSN